MTYLEKFRADHPEAALEDDAIIEMLCPEEAGYELPELGCGGLDQPDTWEACRKCWTQEAPEGEADCHTSAAALVRNDGEDGGAGDGV